MVLLRVDCHHWIHETNTTIIWNPGTSTWQYRNARWENKQRNGPHPVSSRANNHPNRPNTCHLQRHGLGPSKTYKIRCGLEVGLLRPAPQRTGGSQRVQDLTAKGCEPLESS